ncbi:hypothetical protein GCM10022408_28530 [Hymenobacter fastidiosus]|uniref:PKD domain-containing protein n=1 Tax=Hymenobacter fastidiosus TaxID=486264 RepID=A0ABP7SMP1_9BACT
MRPSFLFRPAMLATGILLFASCSKKPEACFSVDKGSLSTKVNEEIQLNATCSNDADSYAWEYGDGAIEAGAIVKHKYLKAGTYTVKMTAKGDGKSDTASKEVVIQ